MAKLFSWPPKSKLGGDFESSGRVVEEWNSDDAMSWSASVAFYTLLSLAPLLILMVAIAGRVYGNDAAQGALGSGLAKPCQPGDQSRCSIYVDSSSRVVHRIDHGFVWGADFIFWGVVGIDGTS